MKIKVICLLIIFCAIYIKQYPLNFSNPPSSRTAVSSFCENHSFLQDCVFFHHFFALALEIAWMHLSNVVCRWFIHPRGPIFEFFFICKYLFRWTSGEDTALPILPWGFDINLGNILFKDFNCQIHHQILSSWIL